MEDKESIEVEAKIKEAAIKAALKILKAHRSEVSLESSDGDAPSSAGAYRFKAVHSEEINPGEEKENSQKEISADLDGSFSLLAKGDGIFLRVYPPEGQGQSVGLERVMARIRYCEIKDFDMKNVMEAVSKQDSIDVWIAPVQPITPKDGEITITVSRDKVTANALISEPWGDGKPASKEDIESALMMNNVTYGVEWGLIERIAADKRGFYYGKPVLLAQGVPPIDGENASVEYLFERGPHKKELIENPENLRIDFREINEIINVTKDEPLAKKTPPTPGVPGVSVFGEGILQKAGKDRRIPIGQNVYTVEDEDGETAFAKIDGTPHIKDGKITVLPIYQTSGDVDFSVGNIDFIGSVVIRGWVRDGFSVKAKGSIEVRGGVEGATLEAEEAIIIGAGVQSHSKGIVKAGGDVTAKYISNAIIHSRGNVIVGDAVLHSEIFAHKKILVKRGKGLISGGVIRAGEDVDANNIGSHLGTETVIEVGIIPEVRAEYDLVKNEIEEKSRKIDDTEKAILLLEKERKEKGFLTKDRVGLYERLKTNISFFEDDNTLLKKRLDQLKETLFASRFAKVSASRKIFSQVKVTIRGAIINVTDELDSCSLYEKNGEIHIGTYSP
ncbi:MAG: FapA family protein [Actinomycetota bacterium]|nr:FapA family protein [Actinomycetota bacterium]